MTAAVSDESDEVGAAYLSRLTDADLRTLVRAEQSSGTVAADRIAILRRQPALIVDVMNRLDTSAAVLNLAVEREPAGHLALISPFLVFAAAIHRTASDLAGSSYAPERTAPRMRVPVFDAGQLTNYLHRLRHRLLLADLLTSFTRISSGLTVTQTPHGLRRRRWNDTDPGHLAVLLNATPEGERPPVWRRLGDMALFLAGVFPDAAERIVGRAHQAVNLARRTGLSDPPIAAVDGIESLEWLGVRWYQLAARRSRPDGGTADAARTADHFHAARRVLNIATDRYLLPVQGTWFVPPR